MSEKKKVTYNHNEYTVVAEHGDLYWLYRDGMRFGALASKRDCEELPKVYTQWINLYRLDDDFMRTGRYTYHSKKDADDMAKPDRVACVCVTFKEGDGLD